VFALPSHHEGLPVTVMEATSVGVPLVVTAVGELPRIFTNRNDAMVVPPGRPDLLAATLEALVNDPALRKSLGEGALRRSGMFDVASATRQVEDLYRRLLARAPDPDIENSVI
jgi:glycosyltransferase involved in cell wall biosynthesis